MQVSLPVAILDLSASSVNKLQARPFWMRRKKGSGACRYSANFTRRRPDGMANVCPNGKHQYHKARTMNFDRIYEYRFRDIDEDKKKITWEEIARFMYEKLSRPAVILDPAAGKCELINAIASPERWAVDLNDYFIAKYAAPGVKIVVGDIFQVSLPENYFDAVFVSNFLEHLHSQEEVASFLEKMFAAIRPGGKIAVMGPNFKYAYRTYFDFADHTVILSELGLAEHLYGAGFELDQVYPRFLPLSFRGGLPVRRFLVKTYLSWPWAWRFMGKQFLLIGKKPMPA